MIRRAIHAVIDWADDHFFGFADFVLSAAGALLFVLCIAGVLALVFGVKL